MFLADDGFGVALAERLAARPLPPGVEVVDYGIRGMDLAYALGEGWDAVVLLDAAPTGRPPGTLSVIEPDLDLVEPSIDAHGMDPVKVLGLARALGGPLPRTLVVACAPEVVMSGDERGRRGRAVAAGAGGARRRRRARRVAAGRVDVRTRGGTPVMKVLLLLIIAMLGVLLFLQGPEIRRYLKIRSM